MSTKTPIGELSFDYRVKFLEGDRGLQGILQRRNLMLKSKKSPQKFNSKTTLIGFVIESRSISTFFLQIFAVLVVQITGYLAFYSSGCV